MNTVNHQPQIQILMGPNISTTHFFFFDKRLLCTGRGQNRSNGSFCLQKCFSLLFQPELRVQHRIVVYDECLQMDQPSDLWRQCFCNKEIKTCFSQANLCKVLSSYPTLRQVPEDVFFFFFFLNLRDQTETPNLCDPDPTE